MFVVLPQNMIQRIKLDYIRSLEIFINFIMSWKKDLAG